ncbi:hypothetical protein PR003_g25893 [Phytophthora rubi]|uniref:Myb-like domain-containing protein n=1 Tax=Phytophthora rubi TaxID=129364 RepID=A0A6A3I7Q7_9STRA|nr:hypothetical protein PR002_g24543 [Phytophthora rubi]KAE9288075.1 hypothetical protein PR003_g25893 [Phytophthora rubi]
MISKKVHDELMSVRRVLNYLPVSPSTEYGWTPHECQVFWAALDRYPRGPWTVIAEFIGTKSTRQAMTHGQKLRQKLKRWGSRLHRNPTARSLMNGDGVGSATTTTTYSASVSVETKISVTVSTSLSESATTPGLSGRATPSVTVKNSTPQNPIACQRTGATNFVSEQQPRRAARTCASSVTMQVDDESMSSRPSETAASRPSMYLQMLFEPNAMPRSAAATTTAMQFDETKHNEYEANALPHPINEVAMPVRNLLDELADVLWNDHRAETK